MIIEYYGNAPRPAIPRWELNTQDEYRRHDMNISKISNISSISQKGNAFKQSYMGLYKGADKIEAQWRFDSRYHMYDGAYPDDEQAVAGHLCMSQIQKRETECDIGFPVIPPNTGNNGKLCRHRRKYRLGPASLLTSPWEMCKPGSAFADLAACALILSRKYRSKRGYENQADSNACTGGKCLVALNRHRK